jgi:hypothetical protein
MNDQCAQCSAPRPAGRYLCATCENKMLGVKSEPSRPIMAEKKVAPVSQQAPRPKRAARDMSTLVVSQRGDGDYTTISAAVEAITSGGRVMIRPGVYTEEVEVNRPMYLLGVGLTDTTPTDAAQVILQGRLHLHGAAEVQVSHVTVRQGGVEISDGRATLRLCRLLEESSSDRLLVLDVHGQSQVTVERCLIRGGSTGISVSNGAQLLAEDTELAYCLSSGAWHSYGGGLHLRNCHVHHCGFGVRLEGGVIEDCQVHDCDSGIEIGGRGHYQIKDCGIYQSKHYGISQSICGTSGDLEAIIEGCTIAGSKASALWVDVGNFLVRHCDLRNNSVGITGQARVVATVEYCDLTQVDLLSYSFSKGAEVHLAHNKEKRRSLTERALISALEFFNIGGD